MSDSRRYSSWALWSMVHDEEHPSDQTTIIVTLHVSTEYWLDTLLCKRIGVTEVELDLFDFTYAKKLNILFKLGVLPQPIFANLKLLNVLRNRFVHQLDYVLGGNPDDFSFISHTDDFTSYRRISALPITERRPLMWWRDALVSIIRATIDPLEKYCIEVRGFHNPEDG